MVCRNSHFGNRPAAPYVYLGNVPIFYLHRAANVINFP
jgi:hypothetical protein